MLKLAGKVVEICDDLSVEGLRKLAEDSTVPEYVRDAAVLTSEEREALPDSSFAIIFYDMQSRKMRKYLLNDPGNVWLSAKYFLDSRSVWPKIAQGIIIKLILSRAEKFGISKDPMFNRLEEIVTSLRSDGTWQKVPQRNVYDEKVFLREEKKEWVLRDQKNRSGKEITKTAGSRVFALNPGDDVWVDRPMYEISTPELLKTATTYFAQYKAELTFKAKRAFAKSARRRAEELNVEVSPEIYLYGSDLVDTKLAYVSIMNRARKCDDSFKKIAANLVHKIPQLNADEILFCLDEFDRQAFKSTKVAQLGIPDPFQSILNADSGDRKVVYEYGARPLTLGTLKKVVATKDMELKKIFDDRLVESLKKQPEKAFKALPNPHKKIIANLA